MNEKFVVREAQLCQIDAGLDSIMLALHLLRPDDGALSVAPEAVASMLSLAHSALADTVDAIREQGQQDAKAAR